MKNVLCMVVLTVGVMLGTPLMGAERALTYIHTGMSFVASGILRPFYPPTENDKEIHVSGFWMDQKPVTNAEFLKFVRQNPDWQRSKIKKIYSDNFYLSHWAGDTQLKNSDQSTQPVTFVSWFAAKAYCESKSKRLPSEYEWEFAGQASYELKDASRDMPWRNHLLDVYSRPAAKKIQPVGGDSPNTFGLFDMHTLVWEWVRDFNGSLIRADSREGDDADKMKFCGASALEASEKEDYPSFIRMAYRSSLKANYATAYLGFRCAQNGD